jgi:glycosyltransferase involved in cell wall biosynthesis
MTKTKHIVLVTAWFYPENKVASFRLNSFAKYLNKTKYKVTVVSMTHRQKPLHELFNQNINVYREPYNKWIRIRKQHPGDSYLKHKLFAINNKIIKQFSTLDYPGWSNRVLNRLLEINKIEPIDLILSSYAPVDAHVAGCKFKLKISNVKWIADMRDEMSRNRFLSPHEKAKLAKLEREFSQSIDSLISVSEPILEDFKCLMNNKSISYKEIRNGFDHDLPISVSFNENFTLLYAGTFYAGIKPDTLFVALVKLKEKRLLGENWLLKLLGTHRNFSFPKQLEKHIAFLPPVPNEAAVVEMMNADCNIIIHPPMETKGVYSGKLFEYLSTGKPILALLDTEDVAAQLINDMNAGEVVDFYDIESIENAILQIHENWLNRKHREVNVNEISRLHRKYQVQLLEQLIDELLYCQIDSLSDS